MSGTNVALPDAQTLSPDITVNGANDTFTVAEAGRYRVSYNINSVTPLTLGARLMVDGTEIEASNVMPQTAPLSRLSNDFLVDLAAGAKVSLQVTQCGLGDSAAQFHRGLPVHGPSELRRGILCQCPHFPRMIPR